jgi:hypothetical protein
MLFSRKIWLGVISSCAAMMVASAPVLAQNPRGSATGPTTARGYDHPDQFMHLKDVKPAENMYPVIAHPEQEKAARDKLAALEGRMGKKPNILIFLLDDVGWMDPGFNGGGIKPCRTLKCDGRIHVALSGCFDDCWQGG